MNKYNIQRATSLRYSPAAAYLFGALTALLAVTAGQVVA